MRNELSSADQTGGPVTALVIGEALTDIIRTADRTAEHPGGSPMNVAYGLGRLGIPTTLHTSIGSDPDGTAIRAHLTGAGVTVNSPTDLATTSTAEAVLSTEGSATYTFNIRWQPDAITVPPDVQLLHTGSIAAVLEPGADTVLAAFEAAPPTTLLSFDPNLRPSITPDRVRVLERVEHLAGISHIVKLSDEDAAWIYPDLSADAVLDRFLSRGATLTMMTLGAKGCIAKTSEARISLPAPPVSVVDTIGAGDSFMAGALSVVSRQQLGEQIVSGLLPFSDLHDVADFALQCARITVSRVGAVPPTLDEALGR
jgi:fructokinase